ncbi:lipase [Leucobacter ruminantium]|uniref:Lipase n=1 Tax=Leucobacter ruminantium TaxID=1289170 RepID=A0A939RX64_9MICO|nr:lipase [Leucobacter ruminantium]
MRPTSKAFIVGLVSSITFALGAAPAVAAEPIEDFSAPAAVVPSAEVAQTLDTTLSAEEIAGGSIDSVLTMAEAATIPHHFDVAASIALAESEVGTSRPTGWSAPGECIMSAQRWIRAGGGAWGGGGNPVSNYDGATRLTIADAQPGDIVQYENIESPTSWVTGVHTLMIVGVNGDGTFTIIESNNPGGSGLVSKDEHWTPKPPAGFQAVVWRF